MSEDESASTSPFSPISHEWIASIPSRSPPTSSRVKVRTNHRGDSSSSSSSSSHSPSPSLSSSSSSSSSEDEADATVGSEALQTQAVSELDSQGAPPYSSSSSITHSTPSSSNFFSPILSRSRLSLSETSQSSLSFTSSPADDVRPSSDDNRSSTHAPRSPSISPFPSPLQRRAKKKHSSSRSPHSKRRGEPPEGKHRSNSYSNPTTATSHTTTSISSPRTPRSPRSPHSVRTRQGTRSLSRPHRDRATPMVKIGEDLSGGRRSIAERRGSERRRGGAPTTSPEEIPRGRSSLRKTKARERLLSAASDDSHPSPGPTARSRYHKRGSSYDLLTVKGMVGGGDGDIETSGGSTSARLPRRRAPSITVKNSAAYSPTFPRSSRILSKKSKLSSSSSKYSQDLESSDDRSSGKKKWKKKNEKERGRERELEWSKGRKGSTSRGPPGAAKGKLGSESSDGGSENRGRGKGRRGSNDFPGKSSRSKSKGGKDKGIITDKDTEIIPLDIPSYCGNKLNAITYLEIIDSKMVFCRYKNAVSFSIFRRDDDGRFFLYSQYEDPSSQVKGAAHPRHSFFSVVLSGGAREGTSLCNYFLDDEKIFPIEKILTDIMKTPVAIVSDEQRVFLLSEKELVSIDAISIGSVPRKLMLLKSLGFGGVTQKLTFARDGRVVVVDKVRLHCLVIDAATGFLLLSNKTFKTPIRAIDLSETHIAICSKKLHIYDLTTNDEIISPTEASSVCVREEVVIVGTIYGYLEVIELKSGEMSFRIGSNIQTYEEHKTKQQEKINVFEFSNAVRFLLPCGEYVVACVANELHIYSYRVAGDVALASTKLSSRPKHVKVIDGEVYALIQDTFVIWRPNYLKIKKREIALARKKTLWDQAFAIDGVRVVFQQNILHYGDNRDTDERSLLVMRPALYFPKKMRTSQLVSGLSYILDRMMERGHCQQNGFTFVADMKRWKMANFSKSYAMRFFDMIQNRYPGAVAKFILVDTPPWFGVIWNIIRPMMSKQFAARVTITTRKKLSAHLPKESIPTDMGGKYYFDVDEWVSSEYTRAGLVFNPFDAKKANKLPFLPQGETSISSQSHSVPPLPLSTSSASESVSVSSYRSQPTAPPSTHKHSRASSQTNTNTRTQSRSHSRSHSRKRKPKANSLTTSPSPSPTLPRPITSKRKKDTPHTRPSHVHPRSSSLSRKQRAAYSPSASSYRPQSQEDTDSADDLSLSSTNSSSSSSSPSLSTPSHTHQPTLSSSSSSESLSELSDFSEADRAMKLVFNQRLDPSQRPRASSSPLLVQGESSGGGRRARKRGGSERVRVSGGGVSGGSGVGKELVVVKRVAETKRDSSDDDEGVMGESEESSSSPPTYPSSPSSPVTPSFPTSPSSPSSSSLVSHSSFNGGDIDHLSLSSTPSSDDDEESLFRSEAFAEESESSAGKKRGKKGKTLLSQNGVKEVVRRKSSLSIMMQKKEHEGEKEREKTKEKETEKERKVKGIEKEEREGQTKRRRASLSKNPSLPSMNSHLRRPSSPAPLDPPPRSSSPSSPSLSLLANASSTANTATPSSASLGTRGDSGSSLPGSEESALTKKENKKERALRKKMFKERVKKTDTIDIMLVSHFIKKRVLQVPGCIDLSSRPIFYMKPALYFPKKTPVSEVIASLIYFLDLLATPTRKGPQGGITFMADMKNWKMKNFTRKYAQSFFDTLQNRYPDLVQSFLLVDPPSWFPRIWRIIRSMMSASFAMKVSFTSRKTISQHIALNQLLPDMGGTFLYDPDDFCREKLEAEKQAKAFADLTSSSTISSSTATATVASVGVSENDLEVVTEVEEKSS